MILLLKIEGAFKLTYNLFTWVTLINWDLHKLIVYFKDFRVNNFAVLTALRRIATHRS